MKLYIGSNGDLSAQIQVFAQNTAEARKLCKTKIKQDELEDHFPCLNFEVHQIKTGVINVTINNQEY